MTQTEKEQYFQERTNKHIALVQKWARRIGVLYPKYKSELLDNVQTHDNSKFYSPEKEPYIEISHMYRMKDKNKPYEMDAETKKKTTEATYHHVKHNAHHPEKYDPNATINPNNRDGFPDNPTDASKMPTVYLLEMMADWFAMADEKKTLVRDWTNKMIDKRWKFTDAQKKIIDNIITKLEETR